MMNRVGELHKSKRLCEDHFEPEMFMNSLRNRLKNDAVPTIFPSLEGPSILKQNGLFYKKF